MNMGATPSGTEWCIKALHPSDPLTEVRGIPDQNAAPTMFMNFQTVTNITPTVGATGTWATNIQLIPHPVGFASYSKTDSTGTNYGEVLNSQLTGASHPEKFDTLYKTFSKWRLAYCAVTIYQDGPDLANQGTVVVCQKPVDPLVYPVSPGNTAYTSVPIAYAHAFDLNASDLPSYSASQAMPNAYFGRSREGAYVPLKLTHTHQQWHGPHDIMYQATASALNVTNSSPNFLQMTLPMSNSPYSVGQYPFLSANTLHFYNIDSNNGNLAGTPTSNFCNGNWADICFANMAVTTSLSLFFRFGFECQVLPTSLYSPHLKLSPPYDPTAISAYFSVARELKDGFPADFNDLGKIWGAIKDAASALSPAIEMIPGWGSAIVGAGKLAGRLGDKIVGAVQRSTEPSLGSTASQSDREAAKALVQSVIPAAPPPMPVSVVRGFRGRVVPVAGPAHYAPGAGIARLERRLASQQQQLLSEMKKTKLSIKRRS